MDNTKTIDEVELFWSKVEKTDTCWHWRTSKDRGIYGVFVTASGNVQAHRYSVMLATGSYPLPGMVVHHVCNNKACVNPKHLRVVSYSENAKAAWDDGLRNNVRAPGSQVTISLRIPSDLYDDIVKIANEENRSISRQVVHLLRRAEDEQKAAAGHDR